MVDKEFYRLQEVLEQLEEGWRQEVEKQVRRKSMEGERKMAVMRESLANEKGKES